MRIIVLAVTATLAAAGAGAEDTAPYPVEDCSKLTVQMELNRCADDNREAADTALNKVYRGLLAEQDGAAAKAALKKVERAWIVYRDRECASEVGPQQSGGSIWPMEMSNCLEEKTAARLRQLMKLRGCSAGVSACHPH